MATQKHIKTPDEAKAVAAAAQVNIQTIYKYAAGVILRPACRYVVEKAMREAGYALVVPHAERETA